MSNPSPQSAPAPFVGIWKARDTPEGREFVRDRSWFTYWRSAADVERIPPKGQRKRIAFLGESAARGLYYDPTYTPAKVLQTILDRKADATSTSRPNGPEVHSAHEVIDLAVTAIRPRQLGGLIRQLPALQPDAIVLFAGNNWQWEFDNDSAPAVEAAALAAAFRRGMGHYKHEVEHRWIGGVAERIVSGLAELAKVLGIPVVIVVPEFNLADWRDEFGPPLVRPGTVNEMPAPADHRLLAQAALARGAVGEARLHFEAAKDAVGGLPNWSCPRCLSSTQAILRSAGPRFGMTVVDLPALFGRDGKIPGRGYFMDYCHMNARGIGLAMQATAAAVGGVLSPGVAGREGREVALPEPDPATAAAAHVLAAVHNSILGQPPDVVAHHCGEALRLDPAAARLLRALLAARAVDVPDWLDRDVAAACSLPNARRHMIRTILPSEGRHFPFSLLQEAGLKVAPAPETRRINLLDPRFQPASLHLRRAGYHVEKNLRSEFRFFSPGPAELTLSLCLRTPHGIAPARTAAIVCAGKPVWSGQVGSAWQKLEVKIPCAAPAGTVIELTVEWPPVSASSPAAWQAAQESVDRGEAPDVYLTFGEIHSLVLLAKG